MCWPSFPCSLYSGVFPSLPMSHLFVRYAANSSQHCILASGGTLVLKQCSSAALAFRHCGFSGTVWLSSWRACAISLNNASIACSLGHLRVTLLCPSWSMNVPALFAIQGESVSVLGISFAHAWHEARHEHFALPALSLLTAVAESCGSFRPALALRSRDLRTRACRPVYFR